MSDLEFLTGICKSILNPLPEENEEELEEEEEEDEIPPGYDEVYHGHTPWGEPIITYKPWGIR